MMPLSRSIAMWDVHDPSTAEQPAPELNADEEKTQDANSMIELRLDLIEIARVLDEDEPGSVPQNEQTRGCAACGGCTIL